MYESVVPDTRKVALSTVWSAISSYGNIVISFIIFALLARLLSPTEFGIVAIASTFVDISLIAARGGIPDAVVQCRDFTDRFANTSFWMSLMSGAACFIALVALSPVLAWIFHMPPLALVLATLSLVFLFGGASAAHEGRLQRTFGYRQLATRALLSNIIAGVLAVGLAFAGFGVWSLVFQRVCASFISMIMVWFATRWVPQWEFDKAIARSQLAFGSRVLGQNVLLSLNTRVHELVAAIFLSAADVGHIRMAWRCFDLVSQIAVIPIATVALSTFSRLQSDHKRLRETYLKFIAISALIAIPSFAGLAVTSSELIPILFGDKWANSANILSILCLTAVPFVVNSFQWPLFTAINRPSYGLKIAGLQLLVGTTLSAISAPLGLLWVIASHVVRAYLIWPIGLGMLTRALEMRVSDIGLKLLRPFIAALGMAAVVLLARAQLPAMPQIWLLTAEVFVGILSYIALLLLLFGKKIAEPLRQTRQIFKKSDNGLETS